MSNILETTNTCIIFMYVIYFTIFRITKWCWFIRNVSMLLFVMFVIVCRWIFNLNCVSFILIINDWYLNLYLPFHNSNAKWHWIKNKNVIQIRTIKYCLTFCTFELIIIKSSYFLNIFLNIIQYPIWLSVCTSTKLAVSVI